MSDYSSAYINEIGGDAKGIIGDISGGNINQYIIVSQSKAEILTQTLIEGSPYMGLKKFKSGDKDKFFGREQWIFELCNHLEENNLLFLLGASGSGKSSLIQAGLIPRLEDQWGAARVETIILVPDRNPFESLYESLPREYKQKASAILQHKEAEVLVKLVKKLKEESHKWLIFIDQFEELFTITPKAERDKFMVSLVKLIKQQDKSVKLLMAMRSDFIDNLSEYGDLAKEAQKSKLILVTDLTENELRLAIAEPAARNGVTFEKNLVEQIIKDFDSQAGSLPLLQYTLDLLWQEDDLGDRTLNTATYHQLGGVEGALQKHVNRIYTELPVEQQLATKQILLKLVDVVSSENSEVLKTAVSKRAFKSEFSKEQAETVTLLVNKNLLVSDRVDQEGKSTVEIAHEALLTSWAELKKWITDARDTISLNNRLSEDVDRWKRLIEENPNKAHEELWTGSKLEKAIELRKDGTFDVVLGGLSDLVNEFIDASIDWREHEQKEKVRLQQRAIKSLFGGLTVALIAAVVAGWQWRQSEGQKEITNDYLRDLLVNLYNKPALKLDFLLRKEFTPLIEKMAEDQTLRKDVRASAINYLGNSEYFQAICNEDFCFEFPEFPNQRRKKYLQEYLQEDVAKNSQERKKYLEEALALNIEALKMLPDYSAAADDAVLSCRKLISQEPEKAEIWRQEAVNYEELAIQLSNVSNHPQFPPESKSEIRKCIQDLKSRN